MSMDKKLKLCSEELANKRFKPCGKGYDALQVDKLFDEVIQDYEFIENNLVTYTKEENYAMIQHIESLKKRISELTIELEKEKAKWKYVKGSSGVSEDNYELLKKIGKLERIIYDKLRLSPEEIKNFDPDDY